MMILFENLKAQTKTAHDELEASIDLLSPGFSKSDYVELLKKFYGIYSVVERELRKTKIAEHYSDRFKTPLLKQDLLALGLSESDIQKIPQIRINLPLENLNFFLGMLYVLEGSSLGALILTKHFHTRFDLNSLNGLAFFTGYAEKTLMMWKGWREFSEKFADENHLSHEEIIKTAQDTFSILKKWLTH